jgi:hypothetical protein
MKNQKVDLSTAGNGYRMAAFIGVMIFAFVVLLCDYTLTWEMLTLIALALTTVSVSKISLGKDGLLVETPQAGSMPADPGSAKESNEEADEPDRSKPDKKAMIAYVSENPLKDFSEAAQKVFRTLRYFQNQEFKNDKTKVWGFSIPQGSPDYLTFINGVSELYGKGLVKISPQGLVGLSANGLAKAREPRDWSGPMWMDFKPL